jgi:hypothetical protein
MPRRIGLESAPVNLADPRARRTRLPHAAVLGALLAALLAGLALLALSFVPGWLVHLRHLGGHGLTQLETVLTAWERRSVPILSLGVLLAVAAAALTVLGALPVPATRRSPPGAGNGRGRQVRRLAASAGLAGLALLAASAWPVEQVGHASGVELSAGWPLAAGIGLGVVIGAAAIAIADLPTGPLVAMAAVAVVLAVSGVGGRIALLNLAEGDGRHYADGSYTRAASDGQPAETLTLDDGRYAVGDRWSGSYEGLGLILSLTDDPACPDARGSYRVFSAGGDDIRWEMIVDTCADGARAADLSAGVWRRDGGGE